MRQPLDGRPEGGRIARLLRAIMGAQSDAKDAAWD
jgi:hypothetical protein